MSVDPNGPETQLAEGPWRDHGAATLGTTHADDLALPEALQVAAHSHARIPVVLRLYLPHGNFRRVKHHHI